MAYTAHGHWIPGTPSWPHPGPDRHIERCGGIGVCTNCSHEFGRTPKSTSCLDHYPKQKRDMRPAWCVVCGLTGKMGIPFTRFELSKMEYLEALQKEYSVEPTKVARPARPADDNPIPFAKEMVVKHENKRMDQSVTDITVDDVLLVWFNYTLGNWKAVLTTTAKDGMYYEVTRAQGFGKTFVDSYKKWENSEYIDDAPVHGNKEEGITPTPAGTGG